MIPQIGAVGKRFARVAATNFEEASAFIDKYVISKLLLIDRYDPLVKELLEEEIDVEGEEKAAEDNHRELAEILTGVEGRELKRKEEGTRHEEELNTALHGGDFAMMRELEDEEKELANLRDLFDVLFESGDKLY